MAETLLLHVKATLALSKVNGPTELSTAISLAAYGSTVVNVGKNFVTACQGMRDCGFTKISDGQQYILEGFELHYTAFVNPTCGQ